MNKLKFSLLTAAILLAGALAAGAAAGGVVRPPVGEVQSAGVLPIPTVLGQTAEEVLFYPWSLYDAQELYPVSEDMLGIQALGIQLEDMDKLFSSGKLTSCPPTGSLLDIPITFSSLWPAVEVPSEALTSLVWNYDPQGDFPALLHMFLKDLPASAYLDGPDNPATPVTLSFASAADRDALSYLIRPGQPRTVTEAERTAALERVDRDLRRLFLYPDPAYSELMGLFDTFFTSSQYLVPTEIYEFLLSSLFSWWPDPPNTAASNGPGKGEDDNEWYKAFRKDLEDVSLDEFLAMVETMGPFTVQVLDAQQQIVVLFTLEEGHVFGLYYDVQLGFWSGIGVMC